jgi:hypothetical protein
MTDDIIVSVYFGIARRMASRGCGAVHRPDPARASHRQKRC